VFVCLVCACIGICCAFSGVAAAAVVAAVVAVYMLCFRLIV